MDSSAQCRRCKFTRHVSDLAPLEPRYKSRICRDCVNADARRNHARRPKDKVRNENLKRRYGITLADYQIMLTAQVGVCAVCENPPTERDRFILNVDHDHKSGRVRGLLCILCNTVLGKMNDSPALLRKAADYLEDK